MQLLETELRLKADSQIIVRAIQKVNVVANFGSNSDWTIGPANASKLPPGYTANRVVPLVSPTELVKPVVALSLDAKILEADLTRDEDAEGSRSRLKLRSKEPMQPSHM